MAWKDTGRTIQREDGSNVSGLVPSRMTAADRLLVVAGPELLEACQQLVKHIASIKETWERDGEERNTKMHGLAVALNNRPGDLIFAAIAKATGKAVQG